jgi:zinc/manganese transport system substrate-binding protein
MKSACVLAAVLATAVPALGETRVVATTSSMAMLVREIGGSAVSITTLAPPDRDPHYLLARPSMMVALRRADLLVAVGAELEVGWLPAAMQGAANPKILPGQPGYFEGAAQIDLIETGEAADRSRGDVHPMGNPHFYMDPVRMATVSRALAVRLGTLDPANQAQFASRADAFTKAVNSRVSTWKQQAVGATGVVFYHKDGNYLAAFLGVPVLGYIEPLPGISPSAAHLRALVSRLAGTRGVIVYNSYHPREGPEFVGRQLGWKTAQLPVDVPLNATGATYLDLIDQWVRAITVVTP